MSQRVRPVPKAYKNEAFLDSRRGRPMRIMAEYLEPESRFAYHDVQDTIVVFGSARTPSQETAEAMMADAKAGKGDLAEAEMAMKMSRYYEAARELAHRLTTWSKGLTGHERRFVVCTGGGPGIMEAANRGASEARGLNVGLTISIPVEEFENPYVSRELAFEFHYFFMRKFWFLYLAKAVIAMPGGYGTLDELFEVLTLIQTGKMRKKLPIVLFGTEYWNQVINFDALVEHGTIDGGDTALFLHTDSVDEAYDFLVQELTEHALGIPGPVL
ncbi:MAG: LOG family protein [Alphaproteobacteria bacterium]|nr:LOG family protein [Alphaproteobacteria bacterium]